ncbi:MAG: nucleotidyl transferase AbiEii/AbiGii toxin family protein [Chloracidobacterium sp.]|nr:nucleotidyl transferase AbiEii/AbiGii toxin family protein [Chloracidobacterium sp.]
MLNADVLTFQEFVTHEPLPLSTIQRAVLEFLQGRDDAVLFGAQAVNAYVSEPRATQDVDIMSNRAHELAEELRDHLSEKFRIAVRVREVKDKGLRLYQVRKGGNRHLVDIRIEDAICPNQVIEMVRVLTPPELIASKLTSYCSRKGQPKAFTDRRDIAVLLLRFPELKVKTGAVSEALAERNATPETIELWNELVDEVIVMPDSDDDLNY